MPAGKEDGRGGDGVGKGDEGDGGDESEGENSPGTREVRNQRAAQLKIGDADC